MIFQEKVSKEVLNKLQKKNWYRHGIYRTILLWSTELLPALDRNSFLEEGIERGLENAVEIGGEFFIVQEEFDDFCKLYDAKLVDGIPYLKDYIFQYYKDIDKSLKESARIGSMDPTKLSNKELGDLFLTHFECIKPLHHWLWSMEFLNESFDKKIRSVMEKAYPSWDAKQINTFLSETSYSPKRHFFQNEEEEIVGLSGVDDKKAHAIYEKYKWLKMYFIDERPFSFDEYLLRVKDVLNNKTETKIKIEKSKNDAKKAKEIVESIGDMELKEYLYLMQELSFLKTYRIDAYTLSFNYVLSLRNEIISRCNILFNEFIDHTKVEIIAALNGEPLSKTEIVNRKEWCVVKVDGEYGFYKQKEAVKNVRDAITKDHGEVKSLKGTTAYPGVVRGKARVSFSSKDIHLIEQGEILVCNLTNPDYNPIFKKITGIITDEGGVLCHSAIMAREFKIPCVIGTKIATKVLKDGDMVEVDADSGIITIL